MPRKTIVLIIVIIIILVIATFIASIKEGREDDLSLREQTVEEDENSSKTSINTKHQYKNGEHIFVGTLELPSPCHSFNAEIIPETNPVEISLTINEPSEGTVCAQMITAKDFKVTHKGNEKQIFVMKLNGNVVNMNLFEVSPNEDIDTVDLFFKG